MTTAISKSLKNPTWWRLRAGVVASTLIFGFASDAVAFNPQENPNGIRWQSSSSETWSGSAQTDGSGNRAQLAGTYDGGPDTVNPKGVTGYFGLLDPIPGSVTMTPTPSPTGLSPTPTRTETPTASPTLSPTIVVTTNTATPTPTMPTSTATASPTLTPTEGLPTLTATPTCFITDHDYDLSGDNRVSVEDLILLIQAMEQGTGAVDFNCDGQTDAVDLFLMSQKWEIEIP